MAVEQFLDQVAPVPEHNYFRFVMKFCNNDKSFFLQVRKSGLVS